MSAIVHDILDEKSLRFYRHALAILDEAGVPHMVGGAYAYARYTGVERHTKDFDVFIRREDYSRAAFAFQGAGYKTELTFPHWLGKAYKGDDFVDLIFSAGNGVAVVDDVWFEHAVEDKVFGVDVKLIPAEEMIWSKGLIMERERFDGADVAHIIKSVGAKLDWQRLLDRYGSHWRVLFAHIVLFGFVYPSHRSNVPSWVMDDLTRRLQSEGDEPEAICRGTIISRQQYLTDIGTRGYKDARLEEGLMSVDEIDHWTAGIALDGAK